ncbi:lipopolysaccharide export system permease protein [Breznakibacter xylanolyticus]|uniref:Lipopolysaccharide export system permease protein n=1 Tax=Breznakibacter xylanolyticus TaxID=990 RepID=A0A2W7NI84_9BACT|nr:LptF/LptG family permease [Breznakibacter xylanolyticus]PZX12866.1 lipopolysaccharide export system permease protein [Breznakibacter xylanolyticus]
MKRLHLFILKSFLGPLAMTFFISLFILVMQFLWKYVDELVGKGLEWYVMAELLFYASLQVVPMALPLAILLASLMTFGNMGEHYELTALKAAGISLPRIMKPLMVFILMVAGAAFWFSNNLLPVANLKLYSLLYDVRQTRPELDIKEKVFYDGIEDFSIKIEDKDRETNMMHDIMIYDHRDKLSRNSNVTIADSGKLQVSEDKKFMILTLYNGVRFDEKVAQEKRRLRDRELQSFRTDIFESQTALIELQGFDFTRSDEGFFKSSDRMKNLVQLRVDEDSIQKIKTMQVTDLSERMKRTHFKRVRYAFSPGQKNAIDSAMAEVTVVPLDSAMSALTAEKQRNAYEGALRAARENRQMIEDQNRFIEKEETKIVRHQMERHRKFTLPFACIIFFFIGAPLGAIIRKGGLGMPVVISVLFFILYYVINTTGEKMARESIWETWQGMWLSSGILLVVGAFITYKSSTDSALLNSDAYTIFFQKLFRKRRKLVKAE